MGQRAKGLYINQTLPLQAHEPVTPQPTWISTDLRDMQLDTQGQNGTHCAKEKPKMKWSLPLPGSVIVMESRKALYCPILRVGSSRWSRLAQTLQGVKPSRKRPDKLM